MSHRLPQPQATPFWRGGTFTSPAERDERRRAFSTDLDDSDDEYTETRHPHAVAAEWAGMHRPRTAPGRQERSRPGRHTNSVESIYWTVEGAETHLDWAPEQRRSTPLDAPAPPASSPPVQARSSVDRVQRWRERMLQHKQGAASPVIQPVPPTPTPRQSSLSPLSPVDLQSPNLERRRQARTQGRAPMLALVDADVGAASSAQLGSTDRREKQIPSSRGDRARPIKPARAPPARAAPRVQRQPSQVSFAATPTVYSIPPPSDRPTRTAPPPLVEREASDDSMGWAMDADGAADVSPGPVAVSPFERRSLASSLLKRRRRSVESDDESVKSEARDKFFDQLNDHSDIFHEHSAAADMAVGMEGSDKGVQPAHHRDKMIMNRMVKEARDRHEVTRQLSSNSGEHRSHHKAHKSVVQDLEDVRTLTVSIEEKILVTRALRHNLDGHRKEINESGWYGSFVLELRYLMKKIRKGLYLVMSVLTRNELWKSRIHRIERVHGSTSGVFFRALKWIIMITVLQAIIWSSAVFIPFGMKHGWNADDVLVPGHPARGETSSGSNFVGLFTGGGMLNTSFYFYGGYTVGYTVYPGSETVADRTVFINATEYSVPGTGPERRDSYNFEVAYMICAIAYVAIPLTVCVVSLFFVLRAVYSGADETPKENTKASLARFKLAQLIFASWEYNVSEKKSVVMNQNIHAQMIKTVLEEERLRKKRGTIQQARIYAQRFVIEVIILAMIIVGSVAVFVVTERYHESDDQYEQLYPSLLITAVNSVYPDAFYILGEYEEVHPMTLNLLTLLRSQVMRVVAMYVFIYTLLHQREGVMCWESSVGAGIYNLFVVAMIAEWFSSMFLDAFLLRVFNTIIKAETDDDDDNMAGKGSGVKRATSLVQAYSDATREPDPDDETRRASIWSVTGHDTDKKAAAFQRFILRFMGPPAFNFKRHMIELVYTQGILTFGIFFSPALVFIGILRFTVNMYIKSWSTMKYCKIPSKGRFYASQGLQAWVWLVFVGGILVSAVPLAYILSATRIPCSGDKMPSVWQHQFFKVPGGFTDFDTCPTGLPTFTCGDCYSDVRNLSSTGCWNEGSNENYIFSLAQVCALCPTGCGPFRNFATPYSALVAESYEWPQGYQDAVLLMGSPVVLALIIAVLIIALVYLYALASGRRLKVKRLQLELEVHTQLINNNYKFSASRAGKRRESGLSDTSSLNSDESPPGPVRAWGEPTTTATTSFA